MNKPASRIEPQAYTLFDLAAISENVAALCDTPAPMSSWQR